MNKVPKESVRAFIFKALLTQISTSRLALPLIIACVVGICTGFLTVGFIQIIHFSEKVFFVKGLELLSFMKQYAVIIIPAAGGIIVGLIVTFVAPEAKGHGVPEVMNSVALKGGKIRPIVVIGKAIASAIAIGSGASVGREGPIVQVGSALGSNIGRLFRLSESRVKNLVACGAAAGIAGVFNAPIAGVMFSLEVILRDFGARALSTVVVSAVSASIISQIFLGNSPAFIAPSYSLWSPFEIFLYLGLGALSAVTAVAFIRVLHFSEKTFDSWKISDWIKPAVGGLLLGCVGLFFPQVFGSGLHTIEQVLHGQLGWKILVSLIFLKIIATSLSLGSGSSGGVFAPALFIGAVLGGAVGNLFYQHMPFPVAPPGAYALVGMAAVFAGAAHAPVTAILIVFEMTGDYRMILPIMVATVISTSLSQYLMRESIYTIKLKERGIDIDSLEEVHVLGALLVRDAMTDSYVTVARNMPVKELVEKMAKQKSKSYYAVNSKNELTGVIYPEKIQEVMFEKDLSIFVVDDVSTPAHESCSPDDSLTEVAHLMMKQNMTQLPVLDPQANNKVIGVLKSENIFRAYTEMSVKRTDLIGLMEQKQATAGGTIQIHFNLPTRSALVGKKICEIQVPNSVVLTSVQRRDKTLIPEGKTVLRARDKIWAVVMPEFEKSFRDWLKKNKLEVHNLFD